jgi:phosphatidylglycerol:prolipoprotein diacylglycerol transferase
LAHPVQDLPADWIMPTIHPAQIYSWLNAVLLFVVLWFLFRSKRRHGQILGTFGALYSVSRFLIEVLRSDEAKAYLFGLPTLFRSFGRGDLVAYLPTMTISQNVSVVVFIISIIFLRTILRSHHRALVVKPTAQ